MCRFMGMRSGRGFDATQLAELCVFGGHFGVAFRLDDVNLLCKGLSRRLHVTLAAGFQLGNTLVGGCQAGGCAAGRLCLLLVQLLQRLHALLQIGTLLCH